MTAPAATAPSWAAVVLTRVAVLCPSSGSSVNHAVGPAAHSSLRTGIATMARTTWGSNCDPAQRTSSPSAASLRTVRL